MGLFPPAIFDIDSSCQRKFDKTHELLLHRRDDTVWDTSEPTVLKTIAAPVPTVTK